jgi:hypothetical protein
LAALEDEVVLGAEVEIGVPQVGDAGSEGRGIVVPHGGGRLDGKYGPEAFPCLGFDPYASVDEPEAAVTAEDGVV